MTPTSSPPYCTSSYTPAPPPASSPPLPPYPASAPVVAYEPPAARIREPRPFVTPLWTTVLLLLLLRLSLSLSLKTCQICVLTRQMQMQIREEACLSLWQRSAISCCLSSLSWHILAPSMRSTSSAPPLQSTAQCHWLSVRKALYISVSRSVPITGRVSVSETLCPCFAKCNVVCLFENGKLHVLDFFLVVTKLPAETRTK